MPATAKPERPRGRLARLVRFACVGGATTLAYAAFAWLFTVHYGLPAAPASLIAYGLAAVGSYVGHRVVTFASHERHRRVAPRFALVSGGGYLVALAAPLVLTDGAGLHPVVAIGVTCVAVPLLSLLAMQHFVFRETLTSTSAREGAARREDRDVAGARALP